MTSALGNQAGIRIDVDELIAVRAQLEGLHITRLRRRATVSAGARQQRLRGRGMEYDESRAYVQGDDVRTMDWRVMARTGEAHTKVYAEERERSTLVAVDLSPSMFFGTRQAFKSWAAARLAAHLGWLASFAGERIGGLVVGSGHHAEIRPGKTRSGLLGLFHHLALADRRHHGDAIAPGRLDFLLTELRRVAKPGIDIVLISDFLDVGPAGRQALSALTRHNQLHAFWIYDDSERETWPADRYPLLTPRGRELLDLQSRAGQAILSQGQQVHIDNVESLCSDFNLPLTAISCNHDITRQLLEAGGSKP